MTETPRPTDVIARKRDGEELDEAALGWFVNGYTDGLAGDPGDALVSEGQMGAFLMAGVLQGFTEDEVLALTRVLVASGEVLDLSSLPGPTVDKHSTGGVGDGTTLLVAPLLAAAGAQLVKLSGRGLGHTGGTLDKLDAIPGLRTDLDPDELRRVAAEVGCVVAAQTARLVPADAALYALRDVTATVASTALIASSVMAKKIASGAEAIVLDVKAGGGAFMADVAQAELLASVCTRIAVGAGRRCTVLVTAMDQPLGRGIGNALEVAECVELLRDPPRGRLAEVALEMAAEGLASGRVGAAGARAGTGDVDAARAELAERWARGEAMERFERMIAAQGGDPRVCEDPRGVLPSAPHVREVPSPAAGAVSRIPARAVGELAASLGAGRTRRQDPVDPAVGLELGVEVGDVVEVGTPLGWVHARTPSDADRAVAALADMVTLIDLDVPTERPILSRIT